MSRQRIAASLFFILLLFCGFFVFKDYGINWDEPIHEWRGRAFLAYVLHGDQGLRENELESNYGSFPDILLALVSKPFERDSRALYLARHLALFFIFFLGVWFFFLLCRKIFSRWEIALLSCLLLVLSPRIFAHSFYNAKDTPLMTAVIVAFYTLLRFLEKPGPARMIWLALACAIATDVRLMGMLTFFLAGIAFFFLLWQARKDKKKVLGVLALALGLTCLYVFLAVLLWPTLWDNPVGRFISVLRFSAHHPWPGSQLYLGRYYYCGETPWHYIPVWIAVSTPLLYLGLFFLGVCGFIEDVLRKRSLPGPARAQRALILLWFFVPPSASILLEVCTYNEFRHLFFIYPALLLIALRGFLAVYGSLLKIKREKIMKAGKIVLAAVMIAGIGQIAFFMIKNHPHQNVYFNRLAGRDMASIARNFELDYWGLSYKQGLEYLLRIDRSEIIKVAVDNRPGQYNVLILPREDRRRLITLRPLYVRLNLNRKILRFASRHPSRYFVNPRFNLLVVRSRMATAEKDELLRICRDPGEKEAIEEVYRNSQDYEPSKYFMTNYSSYPGEFPLEKIHSIKVGNASVLGIYRLEEVP